MKTYCSDKDELKVLENVHKPLKKVEQPVIEDSFTPTISGGITTDDVKPFLKNDNITEPTITDVIKKLNFKPLIIWKILKVLTDNNIQFVSQIPDKPGLLKLDGVGEKMAKNILTLKQ